MTSSTNHFELPDDPLVESPAAKRREELLRESRRAVFRDNFTTALFFLIILSSLILTYYLAQRIALRPQIQNIDLEHVSMQDWNASFHIDFPDSGIPASLRNIPAEERILPRAIIGGEEQSLALKKTPSKAPERLGLKIFIPEGSTPGVYSGALAVRENRGILPEQALPIVIEVLDPFQRFRYLLLYFAVITVLVILSILYLNPLPYGYLRTYTVERAVHEPSSRIQTQELKGNHRGKLLIATTILSYAALWWVFRSSSTFTPTSKGGLTVIGLFLLVLFILFVLTNPFSRGRIKLKDFDDEMPEGEIEFIRRGFPGKENLSVTVRIWDENRENMKSLCAWPNSVRSLDSEATAQDTLTITHRRPFGSQDIFAKYTDQGKNKALCFQFLRHMSGENSESSTAL